MKYGYADKILRVNLTNNKITEEELKEDIIKKFLGQVGYAAKIIYDEIPAGLDSFDPQNIIIFMNGPFTGTTVQAPSNFAVITKNPFIPYMTIADSHGYWGPRLKFAGFDGIIIQGASEKPCYLWIHEGKYEIRDAKNVWGKNTYETEDLIRKEVGEKKASVAGIGVTGENVSAGAMIENDKGHVASKGHAGAVMGSKKLKAIAVFGTQKPKAKNEEKFKELAKQWREDFMKSPLGAAAKTFGTTGFQPQLYEMGDVPIKNMTTNIFAEWDRFSRQYFEEHFKVKNRPCWGCSVNHVKEIEVTEGPYKGLVAEEPEWECLMSFGPMIGVKDAGAAIMLSTYCDQLGMDVNYAGSALGFIFEAYEKGLITDADIGGLKIKWGDEKVAKELLRQMAYKEGIGAIFSKGLKEAAKQISGDAVDLMVYLKGSEPFRGHDSRSIWSMLIGHVITIAGVAWEALGSDLVPDPDLGLPPVPPEERFIPQGKAKSARLTQLKKLFIETLGVCWFGAEPGLDLVANAYTALTGYPLTREGTLIVGERVLNLVRAFNIKHGYTPKYDLDISPKFLNPPIDGPVKGITMKPHLESMIKEYNKLSGWDNTTGKPLPETLKKLELDFLIKDLWD